MEQERLQKKQKEAEKRKRLRGRMKQHEEQLKKQQQETDERKEREHQQLKEKVKKKDEERKKIIEENEKIYKENLKKIEKPLYKKIEKQYEQDYVIPELEKRKIELAKKRNFFQPINSEELEHHANKYEQARRQESAKRAQKFKINETYDPSKYKSKFLDSVLDYDEDQKVENKKKYEEMGELVKKKKNYSKLVLETHKPKVSQRKKMEMQLIKQNLENPTAFERIKKRMVSSSQNKLSPYKGLNSSIAGSVPDSNSISKPRYKNFDWREKNRFVDVPKPPKEFKKLDYLSEMRTKKGTIDESRSEIRKVNNWDEEVNKFEGDDRITYMKGKARYLEQEALRKEQLMKVNQGDNADERNEVNNMIIDSIKAKIALLDNIE
jgi:archaellin